MAFVLTRKALKRILDHVFSFKRLICKSFSGSPRPAIAGNVEQTPARSPPLGQPAIFSVLEKLERGGNIIMKRRDFCKSTLMGGALAALPAAHWRAVAADTAPTAGSDIAAVKLSGDATVIPAAAVKDFAANLHGRLLTASDPDYEQARRIWNKMIDRRPALIARCSGAADIARAVAFARERELLVAVRGGGHSFPGYSTCDGGLVIDLSAMRGVSADPQAKTARVAGGAWNGDLDWEAQQY